MNIISIIFIAVGLAMDAFAVSITSGITIKSLKINNALKIAAFFGLFQAIMPILGWLAGLSFREIISDVDHWIAFGLLFLIGCKMIYESSKMEIDNNKINPLNLYVLLMLSIATSIDALAIGLTLSFLKVSIILPAIIIGAITFSLSVIGVYFGNKFGHYFERKIEMVGGFILIGIGIKILIEHLT
jgi:putative Mn2+ efflux pump MntP